MTMDVNAKMPIKSQAALLPLEFRAMNHPGSLVTFYFPSCELSHSPWQSWPSVRPS